MFDIKKAREEYAGIYAEAKTFEEKYAETKPTDEEQAAQDARYSRMDEIKARIEKAEKLAKYAFEHKDSEPSKIALPKKSADQVAYEKHEARTPVDAKNIDRVEFGRAL